MSRGGVKPGDERRSGERKEGKGELLTLILSHSSSYIAERARERDGSIKELTQLIARNNNRAVIAGEPTPSVNRHCPTLPKN